MTTAQALLKDLYNQEIKVILIDGDLELLGDEEALTDELCTLLAAYKAELIEILSPTDVSDEASDPFDQLSDVCSQCGSELEYYSDQGEAFCEQHRFQVSRQLCQASPALALVTQEAFFEQDLAIIGEQLRTIEGPIALDLETTGLSPQLQRIVSISLGIPGRVFVIDTRPYYTLTPERQIGWKQALTSLFDQRADVTWIGQNLKFDWSFLAIHFDIRLRQVYDTMLAEQVLQAGRDTPAGFFTLSAIAERYGLSVSKQQRNWFIDLNKRAAEWAAPFPAKQLLYMMQDIEIPHRIAELQRAQLAEHELTAVAQLENQTLPAIASMEVYGVLIDEKGWQRILEGKRAQQAAMEHELVQTLGAALQAGREQKLQDQAPQHESHQQAREAEAKRLSQEYSSSKAKGKSGWPRFENAGLKAWDALHPEPRKLQPPSSEIKLSSPQQVKEALGYIGIQVSSTQEEVLEAYTRQYPIIERFLAWRKLHHFCHNFGDNMLAHIKADGRIHASFFQAGAVSGRITCRDPNLQQIPKQPTQAREGEDVRRCFIAPEGSYLLTADLSNIELRILAEVSGDTTILQLFEQGKDMHAETARAMFGLSADIDPRQHLHKGVVVRDIAKTINFGLIYGMGVQGLANRIGVSREEAQELVHTYFSTYQGIDKWSRQATREVTKNGYATTLAGRKRFFDLASTDKFQRATAERAAKNHPIQGTNADILKRALALLYTALPPRVHLLLCVHDEIVLECPEDLLAEAERILKETMVQACRDYLKVVAIPEPEVVVGHAWIKK